MNMISALWNITGMYSELLVLIVYNKYREFYYCMSVYLLVNVLHKLRFSLFSYCLAALNNLITALRLVSMVKHCLIKTLPDHSLLYCSHLAF
jgi:hypothetical protein